MKNTPSGNLIRLHLEISKPKLESLRVFNSHLSESDIEKRDIYLTESCQFLNESNTGKVYFHSLKNSKNIIPEFSKFNLEIGTENAHLQVVSPKICYSNQIWRVVKAEFPEKSAQIYQDNYVRFGKQVFQIIRIQSNENNKLAKPKSSRIVSQVLQGSTIKSELKKESSSDSCKYCFEGEQENMKPVRNLCNCTKDSPVHLACFINHMKKKCKFVFNSRVTFYDLRKLYCNICNTKFPNEQLVNNSPTLIVDIKEDVFKPNLILSLLGQDDGLPYAYYVFEFNKGDDQFIKVGSGKETAVTLDDPFLSQVHAKFWWYDGKVYLYDEKSTYGTSIKMPEKFDLSTCFKTDLLIDRFLLRIHVIKKRKACSCIKTAKNVEKNPFTSEIPNQPKPNNKSIKQNTLKPDEKVQDVGELFNFVSKDFLSNRLLSVTEPYRSSLQEKPIMSQNDFTTSNVVRNIKPEPDLLKNNFIQVAMNTDSSSEAGKELLTYFRLSKKKIKEIEDKNPTDKNGQNMVETEIIQKRKSSF